MLLIKHICCETWREQMSKKCSYCGAEMPDEAFKCASCGANQSVEAKPQPSIVINNVVQQSNQGVAVVEKGKKCKKSVALPMAIFGGWFGLHKFYEGKTGMGVLYMFTLGLWCIGWLVDIIAIATKPKEYIA